MWVLKRDDVVGVVCGGVAFLVGDCVSDDDDVSGAMRRVVLARE